MKDRLVLALPAMILAPILALALSSGRAFADDNVSTPSTSDPDGSVALAERFATFAHQTFHQRKIPTKALQLDAALYRAACKLDPDEPRFARALADVLLQLNDIPGATDALYKYMALEPADQTAQVQYIDLCLASPQMQSLDQRLKYLRSLLDKQQIPNPVKSEIAFRASQLLAARGEDAEAMKLLDSARVLNPVNLRVLRIRYIMTQASALPVDRVQQLLGILQANPADPVVASRLAEQLAQLGLVDASITWYGLANKLYSASNTPADPAFVLGASSELLIGKRAEEAAPLAAKYSSVRPEDADGWFVLLSVLKFQLSLFQDASETALQTVTVRKATIAVSNRILVIRKMTGDTSAATRPIDSPIDTELPDLSDDADRFKATPYHALAGPYEGSLVSLAWLQLYYNHDVKAAAPIIDDLARLVPPGDPALKRLRAWQQYIGNDPKGALPKLKVLAATDPLAALGVVLIENDDPNTKTIALRDAQILLNDHPSGVIGAILWSEFSQFHLTVEPAADSGTVATLVTNVPQSFLQLVSEPHGIYAVQAFPLKATFRYGEPILVRITMQNVSTVDLAIGEDCAVHPELWFDAHLRGLLNQSIPGAAIGRLDQRLVLAPGDSVSTIMRVDQDAMRGMFDENPNIDIIANLMMIINPTLGAPAAKGQPVPTVPGMCGYAQPAAQLIDREPTPIDTPDQRLAVYLGLSSDSGGEKIRSMSVIASYINLLVTRKVPGADSIIAELTGKLHRVDNGGKQAVLSYQKFLIASVATGDDKLNAINSMASDDHWESRLLALQIANQMGQKGIPIATQLSTAKDPIVHDYAIALLQSLQAAAQSGAPATPSPAPEAPAPAQDTPATPPEMPIP